MSDNGGYVDLNRQNTGISADGIFSEETSQDTGDLWDANAANVRDGSAGATDDTPDALSLGGEKPRGKNRFRLILPILTRSKRQRTISVTAPMLISTVEPHTLSDFYLELNGKPHEVRLGSSFRKNASSRYHLVLFRLTVAECEAEHLPIHSKVRMCTGEHGEPRAIHRPITYDVLLRRYLAKHGPLLTNERLGTAMLFRQTAGRSLVLTCRHANVTDKAAAKAKLRLAWFISKIVPAKRPVLLFEKDARRYEESARVVYEALIDQGQPDVRFVAPRDAASSDVANRYKAGFLEPHSFAHYLAFFRCRCFIGTEAMSHALELRCQSLLVQRKLKDPHSTYVFLQHGVMYMVSLDSPERSSFRKKGFPPNGKVVVSSEREAEHFIELGGFDRDDLIVCGLPKFDRSYANPGADKILVMPTWRPWEFTLARTCPQQTSYWRMIERIVEAIPASLRDKVVVAPHPLFSQATFGRADASSSTSRHGAGGELANGDHAGGKLPPYDVLLRDVRVLITDYSSISYDAFYRGANVVFYWEELGECMAAYGEPTHLMIDEASAFGSICRNPRELAECVRQNYSAPQSAQYLRRYRDIVTFHDNKNTERLLAVLSKENAM